MCLYNGIYLGYIYIYIYIMYGQRDDVRWYLGVSEDVSIHTT